MKAPTLALNPRPSPGLAAQAALFNPALFLF